MGISKWIELSTSKIDEQYYKELSEFLLTQDLENISCWIDLEEQNVKIPSQPTIIVHQFLGRICNLLNTCEAHAFTKTVIAKLVKAFASKIATAYKNFMDEQSDMKFSQFFAVQQIFDVKFLKLIFDHNDSDNDAFKNYENWLGEFVDPFDHDVISANIDKYVQRALDRVSVLYGVINLNAQKHGSSKSSSVGQVQEGHNIIPLNNASTGQLPRIQLLPISIETQMQLKKSNVQARLPERLKSQLNFGTGFDSNTKEKSDQGITSKFLGLFS